MSILKITNSNFEQEILKSDKTVLLDFWADWCGPCRMISPIIDDLANEATNAKICKINVDEEPELASRFNVMTIPTLAIIKDGKELQRSIGVKSKKELLEMLELWWAY